MIRLTPKIFLCILLNGCDVAPSISALGAYFSYWLFCVVGAIVSTSVIYAVLQSSGLFVYLGFRTLPLTYAALTWTLALGGWLIFSKTVLGKQ